MGSLSKPFPLSLEIERNLEDQYTQIFLAMGFDFDQAKKMVKGFIEKAKKESIKENTYNLPVNFGDILLKKESQDDKIKFKLAKIRNEGVKDQDIRWWWNTHELERKMIIFVDTFNAFAKFTRNIEQGMSDEDSMKEHRKIHPIYGDPDDTNNSSEEDKPLPYELRDRINIYIEKRSRLDPENFNQEVKKASSFNALIRQEIRKGNV